jgi:hypothetical protein
MDEILKRPFEERAEQLLTQAIAPLYRFPGKIIKQTTRYWEVSIQFGRDLSTYDNDHLTALVVLSHNLGVRVEITPYSNRSLRIMLHPRNQRTGRLWERMPEFEDHAKKILGAE